MSYFEQEQFFKSIISSERFLRSRSNGPPTLNGDGISSGAAKETPLFSSDTSRQAYRKQVYDSLLLLFETFSSTEIFFWFELQRSASLLQKLVLL